MKQEINKYFNIKKLCKQLQDPIKIGLETFIMFITGTRNVGKSFTCWELGDEISLEHNKKLVYIRNSEVSIKSYRNSFNADWKDKYRMSLEAIFKLEYNEDKQKYVDGDVVGFVVSVNNFEKIKSMSFKDVNMVIYDEFNTKEIINEICYKFNHIITSIVRKNKNITILCLANRDNENNEFSVNYGDDDYQINEEDYVITVSDKIDAFNHRRRIMWVELGTKWKEYVNNEETIFNDLAQFDNTSLNYLAGNYNIAKPRTVLNYASKMKSTFEPFAAFNYQQKQYLLGTFYYNDLKCKALVKQNNFALPFLGASINLDVLSKYIGKSVDISKSDTNEIVTNLIMLLKNNMLYFDSFDMKLVFDSIIIKHTQLD